MVAAPEDTGTILTLVPMRLHTIIFPGKLTMFANLLIINTIYGILFVTRWIAKAFFVAAPVAAADGTVAGIEWFGAIRGSDTFRYALAIYGRFNLLAFFAFLAPVALAQSCFGIAVFTGSFAGDASLIIGMNTFATLANIPST